MRASLACCRLIMEGGSDCTAAPGPPAVQEVQHQACITSHRVSAAHIPAAARVMQWRFQWCYLRLACTGATAAAGGSQSGSCYMTQLLLCSKCLAYAHKQLLRLLPLLLLKHLPVTHRQAW
jgi:hypothetical protein